MNTTNEDLNESIRSTQSRQRALTEELHPNPIYGSSQIFQNLSQQQGSEPDINSKNISSHSGGVAK
jgi:hypothetical protein